MSQKEPDGPASSADSVFARLASLASARETTTSKGTSAQEPGPAADVSQCPVQGGRQPASCTAAGAQSAQAAAGCPMAGDAINPANNMPMNLQGSQASTSRQDGSAISLSAHRQSSTIPMVTEAGSLPPHQKAGQQVWQYPSEQMFFNAMKRKGWDPNAEDMRTVVAIHNTVNEHAWRQVLAYEALHAGSCPMPRLKKFMGRPNDFSPKARLLNFVGFGLPFDRHDWIVDRCGREVRYVVDFYNGAPQPGVPATMFIDARPALDSISAVWDRLYMQGRWVLSGRWRDLE